MATTITTIEHCGAGIIRWISIDGTDAGTGIEFNGSVYGIDRGSILDCDGCALEDSDWETIAVRNAIAAEADRIDAMADDAMTRGLTFGK